MAPCPELHRTLLGKKLITMDTKGAITPSGRNAGVATFKSFLMFKFFQAGRSVRCILSEK